MKPLEYFTNLVPKLRRNNYNPVWDDTMGTEMI